MPFPAFPFRLFPMAAAAMATVWLAACVPAQVRLPDGFADSAVAHPVSGISPYRAGDPVVFGPYSVRNLRDHGRLKGGASVGRAHFWRQWHSWDFTLTSNGQTPVAVQCEASLVALAWARGGQSSEIELTGLEGPVLGCGLSWHGRSEHMALELSRSGHRTHGWLDSPTGRYEVESLHGMAGTPLVSGDPTGFAFRRRGESVMMVDVLNRGHVWLAAGTDPRERAWLAAAAAALLTAGALDPG